LGRLLAAANSPEEPIESGEWPRTAEATSIRASRVSGPCLSSFPAIATPLPCEPGTRRTKQIRAYRYLLEVQIALVAQITIWILLESGKGREGKGREGKGRVALPEELCGPSETQWGLAPRLLNGLARRAGWVRLPRVRLLRAPSSSDRPPHLCGGAAGVGGAIAYAGDEEAIDAPALAYWRMRADLGSESRRATRRGRHVH
jgi:hypothetical protein